MESWDEVHLNFGASGMAALNVTLAFIMFGVALETRPSEFRRLVANPKSFFSGVFAQFVLLPATTALLVAWLKPPPGLGLGMLLVAACPGGNVSNFLTAVARGNVALSVALTAFATPAAVVLTPLNFGLYASLVPETRELLRAVRPDFGELMLSVLTLLIFPMVLGMGLSRWRPETAQKIRRPVRKISVVVFTAYVLAALAANGDIFIKTVGGLFPWVALHNAIAFFLGWATAKTAGLNGPDLRAVTMETGIQNSGLGLALVFMFMDGLGGPALICGFWGVWHLLSGMMLAQVFLWFSQRTTAN